jgi:hypothetical protein
MRAETRWGSARNAARNAVEEQAGLKALWEGCQLLVPAELELPSTSITTPPQPPELQLIRHCINIRRRHGAPIACAGDQNARIAPAAHFHSRLGRFRRLWCVADAAVQRSAGIRLCARRECAPVAGVVFAGPLQQVLPTLG